MGTAQTKPVTADLGLYDCDMDYKSEVEISWKANITEGDNPVHKSDLLPSSILSTAGHEKSCGNLPGPSGKAKYS